MATIITITALVVLPVLATTVGRRCIGIVTAGTSVVSLRFGAFHRALEPGPHLRIPGIDQWLVVPLAPFVRNCQIRAHSRDRLQVTVATGVELRVVNSMQYAHHQAVFERNVSSILGSAVHELIAQTEHDELFEKSANFRDQLHFAVDRKVERYGLVVEDVHLQTAAPDRRAMRLRRQIELAGMEDEVALRAAERAATTRQVEAEAQAEALVTVAAAARDANDAQIQMMRLAMLRDFGTQR